MKRINSLILLLLCTIAFVQCKKKTQAEIDDDAIQSYMMKINTTYVKDTFGIYYKIKDSGTGVAPYLNDTVFVKYKGSLLNGTVFDQTKPGTADSVRNFYPLSNLIIGWQVGLQYIKSGGSISLLIPSRYGYGAGQNGPIPGNSVLAFDIDLVKVGKK